MGRRFAPGREFESLGTDRMKIDASRLPLLTAALHAVLFAITVIYVYTSTDGQAALVWTLWYVPDFPVSLLYMVAPSYSQWFDNVIVGRGIIEHLLYLPHVIHGLLGTAWWYLMPRLVIALFLRSDRKTRR
jgi:hypothetical protein